MVHGVDSLAILAGHLGTSSCVDDLIKLIAPEGTQQAESLLLAACTGKGQVCRTECLVWETL